MNKCIKNKYCRGFTLIELLIAVLIFSIVIFTLFTSFDAFMVTSENITREVSQSERLQHALKRINLDFEQLYVVDVPRYSPPEFDSAPDPYRFISQEVAVGGKDFSSITFASLAHANTGKDPRNGVARISYYVKENENNSFDLYRADKLQPYPQEIESCADHVLCENISKFEIVYTDINGDEHRQWDSESNEFDFTVPAGIHVKLMVNSQGSNQALETSIRFIPSRVPIE